MIGKNISDPARLQGLCMGKCMVTREQAAQCTVQYHRISCPAAPTALAPHDFPAPAAPLLMIPSIGRFHTAIDLSCAVHHKPGRMASPVPYPDAAGANVTLGRRTCWPATSFQQVLNVTEAERNM